MTLAPRTNVTQLLQQPEITEAVFIARELSKAYHMGDIDVHALRAVNLELYKGELVVLLGASGSGKSTLLNILGGLDVPTSGEVFYRDHNLSIDDDAELTRYRREHVGFVFQFYNLIPSLTALENVELVTDIAENPMRPEEALQLVALGDRMHHFPAQLSEVVIELLSTDAVKVSPGAKVFIEAWGGPKALEARVRLIEPSAFTKVSALGIEEQRVNVIADLTAPSSVLGDGYRVEGRIVVWHSDSVLQVPVSALFRRGDVWSLFVVEEERARLRTVEVGERTPFSAQIKSGVEADAVVIVHPANEITDGTRVEPREQEYRIF